MGGTTRLILTLGACAGLLSACTDGKTLEDLPIRTSPQSVSPVTTLAPDAPLSPNAVAVSLGDV